MQKEYSNNSTGFTLVETIMYVAILGIVLASFISFALSITATRNKNFVAQETQVNAQIIMSFLSDKIRESKSIAMPTAGNESTALALTLPDSSDNLIFNLENGILTASQGSNEPYFLNSSNIEITSLHFTNLSAVGEKDTVAISLSLKYRYDTSTEFKYEYSVQTAASTRL